MVRNWKTTFMGIGTIIVALIGVAISLIDGNPATNPDWTVTIAALTAGWGLIMAKDSTVTGVS